MSSDPIEFELFNEIGIIDQLGGNILERAMPQGMTRAQFTVLNHFVRLGHDEQSPAKLASAFQLTRPTMTSTLGRMEKSGLIEMRSDPADGRAKLVSLTPKGRQMRERCLEALAPMRPLVAGILDEREIRIALPILRKLRVALDTARDSSE